MGFSTKKNGGFISEINVTPFVDVMLVLLVIFMVTAPMMFTGITLKLPKTRKVTSLNLSSKQVILSVSRAGEFYIGKDKILKNELVPEIKSLFQKNEVDILYLRADYGLKYGSVAKLMAYLKRSDITNIALVTEIEKPK